MARYPLRLGQLQRYLNAAEELGALPIIYTGLTSGLRQCELLTLSWVDFHAPCRYISKGKRLLALNDKAATLLGATIICPSWEVIETMYEDSVTAEEEILRLIQGQIDSQHPMWDYVKDKVSRSIIAPWTPSKTMWFSSLQFSVLQVVQE